MYDKLIILHTANYSRKIRDFYGVDTLIKKGFDVEFWNCGRITVEERLSSIKSDGLTLVNINSLSELDNEIKNHLGTKCLFLSYINYAFYSYKLYLTLSSYKVDILYSAAGWMPIQVFEHSIKKRINRLRVQGLFNMIRNRYYFYKLLSHKFTPLKFVMESCGAARADYKISKKTVRIACNSGDYECFMKTDPYELADKTPFAVFIDQYIPYHNDNLLLGKAMINPKDYYDPLNQYFDEFEKINNCKIIIAAHPSAVKYVKENPFNGRIIEYNKSAELVKGAVCVLAQFSTAISFAVLGSKPLILLTSDEIENNREHMRIHIQTFHNMLGCEVQNVNHPSSYVSKDVNKELYETYKYMLLTTKQSENSWNADIIESIAKGTYLKYIKVE